MLIVVSNQPDVARGTTSRSEVEAINRTLGCALPIDEFRVCYHGSDDNCDCRKPKPGMLLTAAQEWKIDLLSSYMVGDRGAISRPEACGVQDVFHRLRLRRKTVGNVRLPCQVALGGGLYHLSGISISILDGGMYASHQSTEG